MNFAGETITGTETAGQRFAGDDFENRPVSNVTEDEKGHSPEPVK